MTQITSVPFHGTNILTDEDRDAQGWSYGPDPDEAYDRMMDDRMEREAEETWH